MYRSSGSLFDEKKSEENENEVKVTFRQKLEKFITSVYGKWFSYLMLFLGFFSCVIYVVTAYIVTEYEGTKALYPDHLDWFKYVDIGILILFLIEYILHFFSRQHKFAFLLSWVSFVNLVTIIPLFILGSSSKGFVIVIKICRIFRFLRIVQFVFSFNKLGETEVRRQIIKILLTLLSLILFSACVLEAVENPVRSEEQQNDDDGVDDTIKGRSRDPTTIHEMIYFVVVTLATVGYGDVVPISEAGRVAVILLILFTIVLIPMQTNDLIRLMGLQSFYARAIYKSNSEVPHLLVTGYVSVLALQDFSVELFHPDHGNQDKNAVVLQQKDPSIEMIAFLHHPQYELFLFYLRGNQMSERDLKRAAATHAKACVILTKKYASDSHMIDHKNILTGLAIKKYVKHYTGKNIRLIMQLIKPESKTHFYSSLNRKSNDQLIIIEEIKMNLLAKSCFSPGIISMISNLITSAGDIDTSNEDKEWMKEYTTGMGYEIYRTDLSHKFQGKKFSEVAAIVYNEFKAILFGLELDVSGQTIIRLNPGNYAIPHTMENKTRVYMICEDKKVADMVALYEMSNEEIAVYQQQKNQMRKNKQKKLEKLESEDQNEEESDNGDDTEREINGQEDTELLESDYTLLPDPLNLMQITRISIQDHSDITNHIVVCGIHPSIYYFLLPLRASYLIDFQYVVILSPEPPSNDIWEGLNRFPKIIYIKGSPLIEEDLQRANINFADKAVILGRDMSGSKGQVETDDGMLDAESIFIYKAIKRCNKNVQIMIELLHSSNSEFLLSQGNKGDQTGVELDFRYELTPLFAAGEIYISSKIDTLTSQAYYNPHIVTILQQILTGGKQSNNVIRTICELAELRQSNLWQISIPEDYLNKTFGELFNYLTVERELLPLGLYRLPGATDNQHPYVYTNPDPSTKLSHRDKVFVLAAKMSMDLLNGHTQARPSDNNDQQRGSIHTNTNIKTASNVNLSDDGKSKIHDDDARKKELKYKLEVPSMQSRNLDAQRGKSANQLDLENLNQNAMTTFVFEQIGSALGSMQQEINGIKQKLALQNEHLVEKMRSAIRQEFSTMGK